MDNIFFQENRTKGKSLLTLPDSYVVVDLETTGLDPKKDEIIEIGALKVKKNMPQKSFKTLVKPHGHITDFIVELTGIDDSMVEDAPYAEDVMGDFLSFAGDNIIVGHNVNFDINFIIENADRALGKEFPNDFVDTMRLSRRLFPNERHHRLCDLEERFCLHNERAHRAMSDVLLTNDCYQFMKRYVEQSGMTLYELLREIRWENSPRHKNHENRLKGDI